MKLSHLTIEEAHKGLSKKDFSCLEITKDCLETIRDKDERLNAFITITEEKAYQQAEKVDKKIKWISKPIKCKVIIPKDLFQKYQFDCNNRISLIQFEDSKYLAHSPNIFFYHKLNITLFLSRKPVSNNDR